MIRQALALWLLAAPVALAQDLPGLFDVTGVAAGDVLNIRAEPSAASPILSALPPDARGVEVIATSPDGRWGQVALPEGGGWVNLRFLASGAYPAWDAPGRPLSCAGTEPFWSSRLNDPPGTLLLRQMDGLPQAFAISGSAPAAGRVGILGLTLGSSAGTGFALVRAEGCSDGMSDRPWGLSVVLFPPGPPGSPGLAGCCAMTP